MGAKDAFLDVARAQIIMKIEPGLADADDLGVSRQRDQLIGQQCGMVGGLVRMGADRAPDRVVALGDRADLREMVEPGSDRQHRRDPGGARPGDDRRALRREIREVEMAMAVDQHRAPALAAVHAAGASTKRGKMPSGLGNPVPGTSGAAASAAKSRDPAGTAS